MSHPLDSDDDSDCDSENTLEILPRNPPATATAVATAASTSNHGSSSLSTIVDNSRCSDDSGDEDYEKLLKMTKPTFATSQRTNARNVLERLAARKRPLSRNTTVSSLSSTSTTLSNQTNGVTHARTHDHARIRREEERARKKMESDQRKRQEQLIRERRRHQEREQRARAKESSKEAKQQEKLGNQQAAGKFAHDEIVVLMDPLITRSNEYGIVTCLEENFSVQEYSNSFQYKKTIQWIRKEYMEGGAEGAWTCVSEGKLDQVEHSQHLLAVMDYSDFIPLIERIEHDVDDDYPHLGRWLKSLKDQWKSVWSETHEPRVTLLLNRVSEDLDSFWRTRTRGTDRSAKPLPSDWELRDSLQWLLIQFQVDCIHCSSNEDIQINVYNFTRAVAEAPYSNQVSELECVRKIKPAANLGDDLLSKVQDTWARQLQMIPKVSEQRARNLVQHYPTMQSLWQAYQAGDETTNRNLLNNCFGNQSSQASLSAAIYKVMSCKDPKEMI